MADRLRAGETLADRQELERFKDAHIPTLIAVLERLYRLSFCGHASFSARQKNTGTIIEKLRREPEMELVRIQDIVGVRIVLQGGRFEQAAATKEVLDSFKDCTSRVKTRLEEPSSGYRAIHIALKVEGYWCEVQVRTLYQNRWAQLFEGLGDRWGRQIRYGKPPDEPTQTISVQNALVPRTEVIQEMMHTSDEIAEAEELERLSAENELRLGLTADGMDGRELSAAQHKLERRKGRIRDQFDNVDAFFKAIGEVVPDSEGATLRFTPGALGEEGRLSTFLVAYRRSKGLLLYATSFPATQLAPALQKRSELEAAHSSDMDVEVVLLAARSEETLRDTHARYFERLDELAGGTAPRS